MTVEGRYTRITATSAAFETAGIEIVTRDGEVIYSSGWWERAGMQKTARILMSRYSKGL